MFHSNHSKTRPKARRNLFHNLEDESRNTPIETITVGNNQFVGLQDHVECDHSYSTQQDLLPSPCTPPDPLPSYCAPSVRLPCVPVHQNNPRSSIIVCGVKNVLSVLKPENQYEELGHEKSVKQTRCIIPRRKTV